MLDARKDNLKVVFCFDILSGYNFKKKTKTFSKFYETVSRS